jgi:hypothetical protein
VQVVAQFHFTPKLSEDQFCKPWLSVVPEFGIIPPSQSVGTRAACLHIFRWSLTSR